MKSLFIIPAFLCGLTGLAQNPLTGTWETPGYLGLETTSEYVLYRSSETAMMLEIREDGQFMNRLLYGCGMNCFKHNTGVWSMPDENHLAFTLTAQKQEGICRDSQTVPMDLGLYAIVKENDTITRLIKSDGSPEGDARMKRYSAIANRVDNVLIQNFESGSFEWYPTTETVPEEVAGHFIKQAPGFGRKAKFVFSTSYFFAYPVLLVEQEGRLYALVHDTLNQQVALYGVVE